MRCGGRGHRVSVGTAIFALCLATAVPLHSQSRPSAEGTASLDAVGSTPADRIAEAMRLLPGERVIEVGAGGAGLTFALARAVGPAGTVYAAVSDQDTVERQTDEARAAGLAQVKSIFLPARWAGSLHAGRRYDVVLLNDVYGRLPDPGAHLAGYRALLTPGKGRLFLLRTAFLPEFDEIAAVDIERILETLRRFGQGPPFFSRLDPELRAQVEAAPAAGGREETRRRIAGFLNRCLRDRSLYGDIARYYSGKSGIASEFMSEVPSLGEAMLIGALLHNYHRAFDGGPPPQTPQQQLAVYSVNHLLLTRIFALPAEAPFHAESAPYPSDGALAGVLARVGFESAGKQAVTPRQTLWEFRPQNAAGGGSAP